MRRSTSEILKRFDCNGRAITISGETLTSKGQENKNYQTPYGVFSIPRHVYQRSQGGITFCPLDNQARIINSTTPYFAKMLSSKMVTSKSTDVIGDLAENHSRNISKCYLQNVLNDVGKIHDEKQSLWTYVDASLDDEVASIAVSIDGTCMYVCQEGYREAMVGTIALYDEWGERLHTTYIGEYPEYGKASFYDDMIREIGRYKVEYPHVKWAGIADGAKDNWSFLKPYVNLEILDFFHATGYL